MNLFNIPGYSLDTLLTQWRQPSSKVISSWPAGTRLIDTRLGKIRVRDTRGKGPVLLLTPDGPCVIEHYTTLIELLRPNFRVVIFDMPGFGFSYPSFHFDFSLARGAEAIKSVMDALDIEQVTLSFTCANGFYAMAAARRYPERISKLILAQTPSLAAMGAWKQRNVPSVLSIPFLGQALMRLAEQATAKRWYKIALPKNSEKLEEFRKVSIEALRHGACFCLSSIVQGLNQAKFEDVSGIRVPTMLVYGDQDRSHRGTDFESLKKHIPQPKTFKFKGCGHFPDLEKGKDYARLVRDFAS